MSDLPRLNRHYAMNVAETASTFAETIIGNATVANAKSKEEKNFTLNAKFENATAMFLNIHARFLFETAFYEERLKGIVSEERFNELMVHAQKEAYCDSLAVIIRISGVVNYISLLMKYLFITFRTRLAIYSVWVFTRNT